MELERNLKKKIFKSIISLIIGLKVSLNSKICKHIFTFLHFFKRKDNIKDLVVPKMVLMQANITC